MKNSKKFVSLLTAVLVMLSMTTLVSAAETGTITVQTLNLRGVEDFEAKDVFTISNVIARTTNIHHRYDISLSAECPVYICTSDFAVELLVDAGNCRAYNLEFREEYMNTTTGMTIKDNYITVKEHQMEDDAGSLFTRPEEDSRPKGEEVYVVKGSSMNLGSYGAVIKVVDDYTASEGDIPVSELNTVVSGEAEDPASDETTTDETEPVADKVVANPTTARVYINQDGEGYNFDAYNIGGNNYFKLRDLAYRFTEVNEGWEPFYGFEVVWDAATSSIHITKNTKYTAVGGEMSSGNGTPKEGTRCKSTIYINGEPVSLTAYTIGGNNYFKLRDLCKAFNYGVEWNGETNSITIISQIPYED